ncbi:MAG: T9SS type A sorting domain-containing protein, partial [Chitinophagales bacterium]|nr:T9SS type A sorting domain-containing protein [Chitinophagales bacterium]
FAEINYNSDTLLDAGDWAELWNRSTGYINLTKYSFKDSHDTNIYNFPIDLQIAPDSRLVLVHDSAKFFARHPNVTNWIGPFDFNLSNGGETLRLFDFNGQIKYSMIYKDESSWPAGADGDGYTLELLDATKDVNVASDWFTGCLEGSPGYAYNPNCNVGINDIQPSELYTVNNLSGALFQIKSSENIFSSQISIFNLLGNRIYTLIFNGSEMQVDLSNEAKGIYFIQIKNKSSITIHKIIIQ